MLLGELLPLQMRRCLVGAAQNVREHPSCRNVASCARTLHDQRPCVEVCRDCHHVVTTSVVERVFRTARLRPYFNFAGGDINFSRIMETVATGFDCRDACRESGQHELAISVNAAPAAAVRCTKARWS